MNVNGTERLGGSILAKRKKKNTSGLPMLQRIGLIILTFFGTLIILSQEFQEEAVVKDEPLSKEAFIEEVATHTIPLGKKYGIRPSVTIAQAILESNWGQSGLSTQDNNYFGIKGGNSSRQYATLEYGEDWVEIQASFRSYPSLQASIEDYAKLIANGTQWNADLYRGVIEADNYKDAAYALSEAGYATDPTYPEKLITLIETYQLDQYDTN